MKRFSLILATMFLICGHLSSQTFTRNTEAGYIVTDEGPSYGATWGDYDGDGYMDLFVANGGDEKNFLHHNNGDGSFTKITEGDVVSDVGWHQAGSWGDYDNDSD